jgi:hypothetical protein
MRTVSMLPLAVAAVVLAGCAAESPSKDETATSRAGETIQPERDLTLQAPASPAIAVASPAELSRPAPMAPPTRPIVSRSPRKPAPAPAPVREEAPAVEAPAPAPAITVPVVAPQPAPVEDVAVGAGRELAPGKTVTAIPASSGPAYAPEADDSWLPEGPARGIMVGGGDTCRRRGGARGIGIAGRIPIGVPRPRLR